MPKRKQEQYLEKESQMGLAVVAVDPKDEVKDPALMSMKDEISGWKMKKGEKRDSHDLVGVRTVRLFSLHSPPCLP